MKLRALYLLAALCAAPADAERFSFGAFGDTPYFDFEQPLLMNLMARMNEHALAFVVHVGDIKSGSDACDRAMYENRAAWFGHVRHPMLVLPGDNDWTDCSRPSNGGYDPLDRLDLFRRTFHDGEFGARVAPLGVVRQSSQAAHSAYVENLRFAHEDVMFMAVHVVGSRNNIEQPREFAQRQAANEAWLHESFAVARAQQAKAAVVMMHANTMLEMAASDPRRRGFAAITEILFAEALAFGRPVLLIHGDTHHYRFDQPLRSRAVPVTLGNITRLEVHGSPTVQWTEVKVDTMQSPVFSVAEGGRQP